jgi:hypothetical protein
MNKDKRHIVSTLVSAGVIAAGVYGAYRVLKSFSSYQAGQRISEAEILAEYDVWLADYERRQAKQKRATELAKRKYGHCVVHGEHSEQCQADVTWHGHKNRCMKCNGGVGDKSARWCQSCEDDYDSINSDD